jgi:hypothetical protein
MRAKLTLQIYFTIEIPLYAIKLVPQELKISASQLIYLLHLLVQPHRRKMNSSGLWVFEGKRVDSGRYAAGKRILLPIRILFL